jgi:hypothetical protein
MLKERAPKSSFPFGQSVREPLILQEFFFVFACRYAPKAFNSAQVE